MRKSKGGVAVEDSANSYFTYRPLSHLPTPPPTARQQPRSTTASYTNDDGEVLPAVYRGKTPNPFRPAIHLVNLIPSSASLASTSVHLVQSMLGRASLPLETIALAVCVLDRLDSKFGRKWRLTCPLRPASISEPAATPETNKTHAKRHSMPVVTPQPSHRQSSSQQQQQQQQLHIDSVQPEIIILAALVIAHKFTEDSEQAAQSYCSAWGRGLWSSEQLNATERSIMENLNYRIMPLCDVDCLADAMVDMQLAGQDYCHWDAAEPSPPHSDGGGDVLLFAAGDDDLDNGHDTSNFVAGHSRSKTMLPASSMRSASVGLGASWATAL
ncbi:Cyclin [Beauveria brongniartii RCEF 3172]|uniref:Cyclin n=1 Tax=Beauveria brongniartii RCEF 3172 TaxID=1081107 RepID=A0A167CS62_9HYPO|nr:Cyclin [Beauveria brongniartii RCEF 3172]